MVSCVLSSKLSYWFCYFCFLFINPLRTYFLHALSKMVSTLFHPINLTIHWRLHFHRTCFVFLCHFSCHSSPHKLPLLCLGTSRNPICFLLLQTFSENNTYCILFYEPDYGWLCHDYHEQQDCFHAAY